MSEVSAPTIEQMLVCATRELLMRRRVYPRWVASGRMTQATADHEIAVMDGICNHFMPLLPPPAQGSFLPDDS